LDYFETMKDKQGARKLSPLCRGEGKTKFSIVLPKDSIDTDPGKRLSFNFTSRNPKIALKKTTGE